MDTGELVAGPIKSVLTTMLGAVRFSQNSKKLAVNGWMGRCGMSKLRNWIEKWGQNLAVMCHIRRSGETRIHSSRIHIRRFKPHHDLRVRRIDTGSGHCRSSFRRVFQNRSRSSISFDDASLPSASDDQTIKLWAFESCHLLASFHVLNPDILVFSPNTYQVAYTARYRDDHKIYICNTPPDILVSNGLAPDALATVRIHGI